MKEFYHDKKILVTGAAGTVGKKIAKQLIAFEPKELRLMDNNETEMFFPMEEHRNKNIFCFIGNVRDSSKLEKLSRSVVRACSKIKCYSSRSDLWLDLVGPIEQNRRNNWLF